MRLPYSLVTALLCCGVAAAQPTRSAPIPKPAPPVRPVSGPQVPGLSGLGPFIIGKPLAAILNPLQAEWQTTVRVAHSAEEIELQSSLCCSIIELLSSSNTSLEHAPRCADSRVFYLPTYIFQTSSGARPTTLFGLYLTFYKGRLARIWVNEPDPIVAAFEGEDYAYGSGVTTTIRSTELVQCPGAAHQQGARVPRTTSTTQTWQRGDVVAARHLEISSTSTAPCTTRAVEYFLIESHRLHTALTACETPGH
jgi:hypothetical protein